MKLLRIVKILFSPLRLSESSQTGINFTRQLHCRVLLMVCYTGTLSKPVYITLLDAPLDSDVTVSLAFVGFSKASIMSWCMSRCFLWSALLAVWNTFNSPISCKSFKVSSFTICIVGAREDLSCFSVSSALFERLPDAPFFAGAVSCGETSSSRLRDGRHPIMLSLKHSRI